MSAIRKILAVDIGNSNIVIGYFRESTLQFTFRIPTGEASDARELHARLDAVLTEHLVSAKELSGAVISSVVPSVTRTMKQALEHLIGRMPLIASAQLETGIDLSRYDRKSLGIDRLIDVVAVRRLYGAPAAVFDLGTATTLSLIDAKGAFRGGMIASGIQLSLTALHEHTAKLPKLKAASTDQLIGSDTPSCMRTGSVIAAACLIDGMTERIAKELHLESLPVIVTGGLGKLVLPWCKTKTFYEPDLQLIGLQILYDMNVQKTAQKKEQK
jgi:type III pantothenate kinase